MPRCYMVKTQRHNPWPRYSTKEECVDPPGQHRANTETPKTGDAEYEGVRSAPLCERSAAETEAAHELLSLAAGVPTLPPASKLTVPDPVTLHYPDTPHTIYIVENEKINPTNQNKQPHPTMQKVAPIDPHRRNTTYGAEAQPTMPPLAYQGIPNWSRQPSSPENTALFSEIDSSLTMAVAREIPDLTPAPISAQVSVIETGSQYAAPTPTPAPTPLPSRAPILDSLPLPYAKDIKLNTVSTNRRFTCMECGRQYATSSNLSRHKQTHRSLDSSFAKRCADCGKVYVSMPALAMHTLTHRMVHVCGVCGKLFSRPWLLDGHVRSHTGEKPYKCSYCVKAFADRSNLRAHLQTHSPTKKYECKRCNKTFMLKSYLTKHQEVVCTRDQDDDVAAVLLA